MESINASKGPLAESESLMIKPVACLKPDDKDFNVNLQRSPILVNDPLVKKPEAII
jgi:hypothetical protein